MATMQFLIRNRAIICRAKEIKPLRGGVHKYAAQATAQIDVGLAKKGRFWTEAI